MRIDKLSVYCLIVCLWPFVAFALSEVVTIHNFQLSPAILTITPGQIVTWVNLDYNMQYILMSDDRSIASNYILYNQSYSQQFNQVGIYPYYCGNVPYMSGEVVVQPVSEYVTDQVNEQIQKLKADNPTLQ